MKLPFFLSFVPFLFFLFQLSETIPQPESFRVRQSEHDRHPDARQERKL